MYDAYELSNDEYTEMHHNGSKNAVKASNPINFTVGVATTWKYYQGVATLKRSRTAALILINICNGGSRGNVKDKQHKE